ncbi:MAG: pyridoxal phosphate-dependent aminotransferase [Alphaproteobacteria bacterium]
MVMRPLDEPSRRSRVAPFRAMEVLAAANARAARGDAVYHLELGEPGGALPEPVRAAIAHALATERMGYTEALGMPQLRRAIADLYADWYGVEIDPARIAVTVGASGAFVLALLAAFDPGARVGVGEPGYPAYKTIVRALDLRPVTVPTERARGFQPTPADLAAAAPLDGVILASPANPTGAVLGSDDLDRLATTCRSAGTRILVDEIYHGLIFEKEQVTLAARAPEALVVNSFSKFFGLTGWRIGWLVLPPVLVPAVERIAQNLFISAPAIAQHAALAALRHRDLFAERRARYAENWRRLAQGLEQAGVARDAIVPADGAFYLYVDLSAYAEDTAELCRRLLAETGVAATPGVDFDAARGHRYARFSVAGETAAVDAAVARLSAWLPAQRRNRAD